MYFLYQLILAIGFIFYGFSYVIKDRKILLLTNITSNIVFFLGYMIYDLKVAAFLNIVSMIREILLLIADKIKSDKFHAMCFFVIMVVTICIGVFTYEDIYSSIPVLANVIFAYSIWQKNVKTYRLCGIVVQANWVVYAFYINSIVSIVCDGLILLGVIYTYYKICKEDVVTSTGDIVKK